MASTGQLGPVEKMREQFPTRTLLVSLAAITIIVFPLGIWLTGGLPSFTSNQWIWFGFLAWTGLWVAISIGEYWNRLLKDESQQLKRESQQLDQLRTELTRHGNMLEHEKATFRQSMRERAIGYPTLFSAIDEFHKASDEALANTLQFKKHPALKAAETVRLETERRRAAEKEAKVTRGILEYYESVAPFLIELREETSEVDEKAREEWVRDYSEEEREDGTTLYLTKEEYRSLSDEERNQRALDRYWARPHSCGELGRMYERYVGYLFEQEAYHVEYFGILGGLEDLGRDLICHRGDEVVIVQCKNWSRHKTIHEKHIFQLFGSVVSGYNSKSCNWLHVGNSAFRDLALVSACVISTFSKRLTLRICSIV
jgi:restriction endonuclease